MMSTPLAVIDTPSSFMSDSRSTILNLQRNAHNNKRQSNHSHKQDEQKEDALPTHHLFHHPSSTPLASFSTHNNPAHAASASAGVRPPSPASLSFSYSDSFNSSSHDAPTPAPAATNTDFPDYLAFSSPVKRWSQPPASSSQPPPLPLTTNQNQQDHEEEMIMQMLNQVSPLPSTDTVDNAGSVASATPSQGASPRLSLSGLPSQSASPHNSPQPAPSPHFVHSPIQSNLYDPSVTVVTPSQLPLTPVFSSPHASDSHEHDGASNGTTAAQDAQQQATTNNTVTRHQIFDFQRDSLSLSSSSSSSSSSLSPSSSLLDPRSSAQQRLLLQHIGAYLQKTPSAQHSVTVNEQQHEMHTIQIQHETHTTQLASNSDEIYDSDSLMPSANNSSSIHDMASEQPPRQFEDPDALTQDTQPPSSTDQTIQPIDTDPVPPPPVRDYSNEFVWSPAHTSTKSSTTESQKKHDEYDDEGFEEESIELNEPIQSDSITPQPAQPAHHSSTHIPSPTHSSPKHASPKNAKSNSKRATKVARRTSVEKKQSHASPSSKPRNILHRPAASKRPIDDARVASSDDIADEVEEELDSHAAANKSNIDQYDEDEFEIEEINAFYDRLNQTDSQVIEEARDTVGDRAFQSDSDHLPIIDTFFHVLIQDPLSGHRPFLYPMVLPVTAYFQQGRPHSVYYTDKAGYVRHCCWQRPAQPAKHTRSNSPVKPHSTLQPTPSLVTSQTSPLSSTPHGPNGSYIDPISALRRFNPLRYRDVGATSFLKKNTHLKRHQQKIERWLSKKQEEQKQLELINHENQLFGLSFQAGPNAYTPHINIEKWKQEQRARIEAEIRAMKEREKQALNEYDQMVRQEAIEFEKLICAHVYSVDNRCVTQSLTLGQVRSLFGAVVLSRDSLGEDWESTRPRGNFFLQHVSVAHQRTHVEMFKCCWKDNQHALQVNKRVSGMPYVSYIGLQTPLQTLTYKAVNSNSIESMVPFNDAHKIFKIVMQSLARLFLNHSLQEPDNPQFGRVESMNLYFMPSFQKNQFLFCFGDHISFHAPANAPANAPTLMSSHSTPSLRRALDHTHNYSTTPSIAPGEYAATISKQNGATVVHVPLVHLKQQHLGNSATIDKSTCVKCKVFFSTPSQANLIMLRQVLLKWCPSPLFEYPEDLFHSLYGIDTNANSSDWHRTIVAICKDCLLEIRALKTIPSRTQLSPWLQSISIMSPPKKSAHPSFHTSISVPLPQEKLPSLLPYLSVASSLHTPGAGHAQELIPPVAYVHGKNDSLMEQQGFPLQAGLALDPTIEITASKVHNVLTPSPVVATVHTKMTATRTQSIPNLRHVFHSPQRAFASSSSYMSPEDMYQSIRESSSPVKPLHELTNHVHIIHQAPTTVSESPANFQPNQTGVQQIFQPSLKHRINTPSITKMLSRLNTSQSADSLLPYRVSIAGGCGTAPTFPHLPVLNSVSVSSIPSRPVDHSIEYPSKYEKVSGSMNLYPSHKNTVKLSKTNTLNDSKHLSDTDKSKSKLSPQKDAPSHPDSSDSNPHSSAAAIAKLTPLKKKPVTKLSKLKGSVDADTSKAQEKSPSPVESKRKLSPIKSLKSSKPVSKPNHKQNTAVPKNKLNNNKSLANEKLAAPASAQPDASSATVSDISTTSSAAAAAPLMSDMDVSKPKGHAANDDDEYMYSNDFDFEPESTPAQTSQNDASSHPNSAPSLEHDFSINSSDTGATVEPTYSLPAEQQMFEPPSSNIESSDPTPSTLDSAIDSRDGPASETSQPPSNTEVPSDPVDSYSFDEFESDVTPSAPTAITHQPSDAATNQNNSINNDNWFDDDNHVNTTETATTSSPTLVDPVTIDQSIHADTHESSPTELVTVTPQVDSADTATVVEPVPVEPTLSAADAAADATATLPVSSPDTNLSAAPQAVDSNNPSLTDTLTDQHKLTQESKDSTINTSSVDDEFANHDNEFDML